MADEHQSAPVTPVGSDDEALARMRHTCPALGDLINVCRLLDAHSAPVAEAVLLALFRLQASTPRLSARAVFTVAALSMPGAQDSLRRQSAMDRAATHQTPTTVQ